MTDQNTFYRIHQRVLGCVVRTSSSLVNFASSGRNTLEELPDIVANALGQLVPVQPNVTRLGVARIARAPASLDCERGVPALDHLFSRYPAIGMTQPASRGERR